MPSTPDDKDATRRLPQRGETWQSKDSRDDGKTVYIEDVSGGFVTYRRSLRRRIRVEGFPKLYRPLECDQ